MERRLVAILAGDVVGYSRLMASDEEATLAGLMACREIVDALIAEHGGHLVNTAGDSIIAAFPSPVEAVRCALAVQRRLAARNGELPEDRRMRLRIGINLGDVIAEGGDLFGDGVNVAARLETLAAPGGICLSAKVHDEVAGKIDAEFVDAGRHPVKNIDAPLRIWAWPDATLSLRPARSIAVRRSLAVAAAVVLAAIGGAVWYGAQRNDLLALPAGPAIAVVPFAELGGNPADASFAAGLSEDIIAALSRFSNLFVFAAESTRRFAAEPLQARALGARFVLTGSVRRGNERLRVLAKLLDAETGRQLWSESYDRDLTAADLFSVQDDVTARVVGLIGSSDAPLFKPEIKEKLRTARPRSLAAYECVVYSVWIYDDFSPKAHAQARDCLEQAVAEEPGYALAWAHLAQMYLEEYKYGYNPRPEPIARALAATQEALALDAQSQYANYVLALLRYLTEESFESFYQAADRAIALNPNNAFVLADLGTWIAYSGDWDRGTALVAKAMKLNPHHQSWLYFPLFLDRYRRGDYRAALALALKMDVPENEGVQAALAAVYGQLGAIERAQSVLERLVAIRPGFADDPRGWFLRRRMPRSLVESLMEGLRKAGLAVAPANATALAPEAPAAASALGELEAPAGLALAVLLALDHARIAGQEAA